MLEISKTTKRNPPSGIPFVSIKEKILGKKYALSLVFIGDDKAKKLNLSHKNKNYPTNVLAFPLDKNEGEIFINLVRAERDHKKYEQNLKKHVAYLFIHACLHLKGYEHGSTMEDEEKKILRQFHL